MRITENVFPDIEILACFLSFLLSPTFILFFLFCSLSLLLSLSLCAITTNLLLHYMLVPFEVVDIALCLFEVVLALYYL